MKGGARKGAGRPKGEGSKLVRVPLPLIEIIQKIIKDYKEKKPCG